VAASDRPRTSPTRSSTPSTGGPALRASTASWFAENARLSERRSHHLPGPRGLRRRLPRSSRS
jgi:hypothetical protein